MGSNAGGGRALWPDRMMADGALGRIVAMAAVADVDGKPALIHAKKVTEAPAAHRSRLALAVSLTVVLLAVAIVVTPFANLPLLPIPGIVSVLETSTIVISLVLAALLFSRGAVSGEGSTVWLGSAYFFTAIILIPLLASFPGALLPTAMIGSSSTPIWMWFSWHIVFAVCIIRFALVPDMVATSVPRSIAGCLIACAIMTLISTAGLPYLPKIIFGNTVPAGGLGEYIALFILAMIIVALILVLRFRRNAPECVWVAVALAAAGLEVWLTYYGSGRFTLGWYTARACSVLTSLIVLLSSLHDVTILHHRLAAANDELTTLANRDGLTGLANRRWFDQVASIEWRRAERDQKPISVVMIDVDHFKKLNDYYGHMQGDDCLRLIGDALRTVIRRPGDLVARYGGEEFVMLLPATDAFAAVDIAQALHVRLRELAIPHLGSPFGIVTISAGVATMLPEAGCSYEKLLSLADANLYLAKQSGRNRTRADPQAAPTALS